MRKNVVYSCTKCSVKLHVDSKLHVLSFYADMF